MKVSYLKETLNYKDIYIADSEAEIKAAYTSDLLSDVMGNAPDESILITIQGHKNTIAVASLAGINTVLLCNKRSVPEDMLDSAKHEGISIFTTSDDQFTASCKIAAGLGLV